MTHLPCRIALAMLWPALAQAAQPLAVDPALPDYRAQAVTVPANARYLDASGAIAIIGNDGMHDLIEALNTLFISQHPGFRFNVTAKGSSVGMGLTGWVDASKTAPGLRILGLASGPGQAFRTPSEADVGQGAYPLSAFLHLFVTTTPGQPLEPFIREYLRLALSEEGQALVRAQASSEEGYLPLSAVDLAIERKKLEAP